MPGLAFILGGPKGDKKPDGPPKPSMGGGGDDKGGGMEGARKDAVRAVARALGSQDADLDSLDSALQAFVEACQPGYSDKE
jgi:hypothetical protein